MENIKDNTKQKKTYVFIWGFGKLIIIITLAYFLHLDLVSKFKHTCFSMRFYLHGWYLKMPIIYRKNTVTYF